VVLAVLLLGALGCGGGQTQGQSFPVEGAIRWKDGTDANELAGGTVEFEPTSKIGQVAAKAEIVGDGTFTLDDVPPAGEYRVRVVPAAGTKVDKKYQAFSSSGISATIGSGEGQQITLVLPGPRPKSE
jgi:hypothetical protein